MRPTQPVRSRRRPLATLTAAVALTAATSGFTAYAAATAQAATNAVSLKCSGPEAVVSFSPGITSNTAHDVAVSLSSEVKFTCEDSSDHSDGSAKVTGGTVTAITGTLANSTCLNMQGAVDISVTWDLDDSTHPTSVLHVSIGGKEDSTAGSGTVTSGQFAGATFAGSDADASSTDFSACNTDSGLTTATTSMTGTISS